MIKNPVINALVAIFYIVGLVFIISTFIAKPDTPDSIFTPVAMLSLFVLSAAVMGFLFLGQPIQLYLAGDKQKAVNFFLQTVMTFAVATAVVLVITSMGG